MSRPYSTDLRERVVSAVLQERSSCHAVAARFGIGVSTAIRWVQRYLRSGSVAADRIDGRKPRVIVGTHRGWLIERCRRADFNLRGLVVELAQRGLTADYRTMWRFVHGEGLSFKTVLAREQDRPDVARRRARWRQYQQRIDPKRLVFLDG